MIVTLLTDFGTADHFVAAMKGVILSRDRRIALVDVTHEIPAHDVAAGAFTLLACHDAFPPGTVHLAVVDPGVGSARRPVAAVAGDRFFVGPDNGLLSHVLGLDPAAHIVALDRPEWWRHPVSSTFHGRDLFAPVAAALATGTPLESLGSPVSDPVRLLPPVAGRDADGALRGAVLHVDRFGNCITSVRRADVAGERAAVEVEGRAVRAWRRFFGDAGEPGEPFCIWGSAGLLEIAVERDSAARALGIGRGAEVVVRPAG